MPKPGDDEGVRREGPFASQFPAPSDAPQPTWSLPGPARAPKRSIVPGLIIGLALAVILAVAAIFWIFL